MSNLSSWPDIDHAPFLNGYFHRLPANEIFREIVGAIMGTTPQRYKTGNEKTIGYLSVKPIPLFVVSHFYSTFYFQILGS
jgi:hypothetical protein